MVQVPDFDAVYGRDDDPWQVRSSFYEQRKLEIVLATLGRARYRRAWDPACGVGELVARLASRCPSVLATDGSPAAVELTRRRVADLPGVDVRPLRLPDPPVDGEESPFDLVVISEFLYYLDADDRAASLALVDRLAAGDAEVMSLHWRHRPGDAYLSGLETQDEISTALTGRGWRRSVQHVDVDFVLDSFVRGGSDD